MEFELKLKGPFWVEISFNVAAMGLGGFGTTGGHWGVMWIGMGIWGWKVWIKDYFLQPLQYLEYYAKENQASMIEAY